MDLCWRQTVFHQLVGCLAHNNAQMTMWKCQITMLELHWTKTLNSANPRINFIHHHDQGIVTSLRSHHFPALPSSSTMFDSTWHQDQNHALVRHKDIWDMGHCGKHIISPKEDKVDLKCSPLSKSQDMGHYLQAQLECLQDRKETIQSFNRPLPFWLHQDNLPAHLVDHPLASQQNKFRQLRNGGGQMLPGLPICPHC